MEIRYNEKDARAAFRHLADKLEEAARLLGQKRKSKDDSLDSLMRSTPLEEPLKSAFEDCEFLALTAKDSDTLSALRFYRGDGVSDDGMRHGLLKTMTESQTAHQDNLRRAAKWVRGFIATIGEKQTQGKTSGFTEEDREVLAETCAYAADAAAKKLAQFKGSSKGGKKGAATRKAEREQNPVKIKIKRFVNDKIREWDTTHPERKQAGYKGHYSNAQIYRDAERIAANTSESGKPIFTADKIKEWFKPSKRKRTGK